MATPNPNAAVHIPADHPFKQGVAVVMWIHVSASPEYVMTTTETAIFVVRVENGVVTYLDGLTPEPKQRALADFYSNAPHDGNGKPILPRALWWGADADKAVAEALQKGLAYHKAKLLRNLHNYPHWVQT